MKASLFASMVIMALSVCASSGNVCTNNIKNVLTRQMEEEKEREENRRKILELNKKLKEVKVKSLMKIGRCNSEQEAEAIILIKSMLANKSNDRFIFCKSLSSRRWDELGKISLEIANIENAQTGCSYGNCKDNYYECMTNLIGKLIRVTNNYRRNVDQVCYRGLTEKELSDQKRILRDIQQEIEKPMTLEKRAYERMEEILKYYANEYGIRKGAAYRELSRICFLIRDSYL